MSDTCPFIVYPVIQLERDWLLADNLIECIRSRKNTGRNHTTITQDSNKTTPEKKGSVYTGVIIDSARKKLRKAIELLVESSVWKEAEHFKTGRKFKFKVNFITLTLPTSQGSITDKELKSKCLDNWIKRMKRKYGLVNYVWRAERQYNGNLHFHIMTDCYIRYDYIRNDWNGVLQQFNFIDEFEKVHKHRNPNSTDVHAVWKIKNLAAYMVKYMSKTPEEHLNEINRKRASKGEKKLIPENHPFQKIEGQPKWNDVLDGKLWDCSLSLKRAKACEIMLESGIRKDWDRLVDTPKRKILDTERFSILFLEKNEFDTEINVDDRAIYDQYLKSIRNGHVHI